MIRALMASFPDIGLEKQKFNENYSMKIIFEYKNSFFYYYYYYSNLLFVGKYWTVANRRNFFINIAKYHKFDPLVPNNWYQFGFHDIHSIKVSSFFILFYSLLLSYFIYVLYLF